PYMLRDGDRLAIGPYIIAVSVEGQQASARSQGFGMTPPTAPAADVWGSVDEAAAPDDRAAYQVQKPQAAPPDFLDFAAFIEPARSPPAPARGASDVYAWLAAAPAPPPPVIPAPAAPAPRRPAPAPPPIESSPAILGPPRPPAPQPAAATTDAALLRRIARAAGIPEQAIASRDPNALADEIGAVIRLTAQNLAQMLSSRAESKTLMRSSSRTMIRALENNPLKFSSSVEAALAIMFGPPMRQYLTAQATIESSFGDLKSHLVLTYSAMRGALDALFEDLAPEMIDHSVAPDRGLGGIVVPRKTNMWDTYVERWRAKTKRSDGRPFPSSPPSAAGGSLSRKRDREPHAARDSLPLGLRRDRNRPRSRSAEQVRVAPWRRRHAGRRVVRLSQRRSGASRNCRPRSGGGADRLAHRAGAGGQYARGEPGTGGERGAIYGGRRDGHRLDVELAHRGGNRGRLSAPGL